ncbi:MAG: radical SAM protein [Melioribacteraceae bacterium]|nr:radical SAM protein [Melioribacteraceae bacterium]
MLKEYAGFYFPIIEEEDKNLRLKLTSKCQWSCRFCHMEGNHGSKELLFEQNTFDQINELCRSLRRDKIHLTGGEPTLYKNIIPLISFFKDNNYKIGITSNGQFSADLRGRLIGLIDSITFSIPTLDINKFITLHKNKFTFKSAFNHLSRVLDNAAEFNDKGIETDVNIVFSQDDNVSHDVIEFCCRNNINVNFLDVIGDLEESGNRIKSLLKEYELEPINYKRVIGTSRARYNFLNKRFGNIFSVKVLEPNFPEALCGNCSLKNICEETYYGLRIEQDGNELRVRPCIQKERTYTINGFKKTEFFNELKSTGVKYA